MGILDWLQSDSKTKREPETNPKERRGWRHLVRIECNQGVEGAQKRQRAISERIHDDEQTHNFGLFKTPMGQDERNFDFTDWEESLPDGFEVVGKKRLKITPEGLANVLRNVETPAGVDLDKPAYLQLHPAQQIFELTETGRELDQALSYIRNQIGEKKISLTTGYPISRDELYWMLAEADETELVMTEERGEAQHVSEVDTTNCSRRAAPINSFAAFQLDLNAGAVDIVREPFNGYMVKPVSDDEDVARKVREEFVEFLGSFDTDSYRFDPNGERE